ncbi:MAG TPA: hypothetical protein VMU94_23540 [Streptosporangiaceae bacterium]|nr:hypothetical protein [Streptosporangiaceae bacterium]
MTSAESEPEAPAQTSFDAATVQALLERLGSEPDEACAISLAAASQEAGAAAQLAFASVLFGPPEMAAEPWPRWSARTNPGTARLVAQWEAAGLALSQYREFSEVREGFLFGRWTVTARQSATMARWLAELLNGQVTTVPGTGSPPLMASPRESTALIRAFPFLASPAGQLIRAAGRPVTGFLFPLEVIPGLPAPQSTWDLAG